MQDWIPILSGPDVHVVVNLYMVLIMRSRGGLHVRCWYCILINVHVSLLQLTFSEAYISTGPHKEHSSKLGMFLYHSLPHGRSTLQVCQRRGWVLFRLFPYLTTKEHPCHVYSELKQIIGHKITYNGITNGFEVKSWQHTTLWTAQCDGEHSVAPGAHCISCVLLCKDALY